jgi:Sec-independent protein translocase protein TatA
LTFSSEIYFSRYRQAGYNHFWHISCIFTKVTCMNLFGIGIPEILFILLLALIIFGPKDLEKTGKTLGRSLNKLIRSDGWKVIKDTGQELKNLPNRLMRESGLEELQQSANNEIRKTTIEIDETTPVMKGKKPHA